MRISDWSSDVCSSDLFRCRPCGAAAEARHSPGVRCARGGPEPDRASRHPDVVEARQTALAESELRWLAAAALGRPIFLLALRPDGGGDVCGWDVVDVAEIGRASGRARVCTYVRVSVCAV